MIFVDCVPCTMVAVMLTGKHTFCSSSRVESQAQNAVARSNSTIGMILFIRAGVLILTTFLNGFSLARLILLHYSLNIGDQTREELQQIHFQSVDSLRSRRKTALRP